MCFFDCSMRWAMLNLEWLLAGSAFCCYFVFQCSFKLPLVLSSFSFLPSGLTVFTSFELLLNLPLPSVSCCQSLSVPQSPSSSSLVNRQIINRHERYLITNVCKLPSFVCPQHTQRPTAFSVLSSSWSSPWSFSWGSRIFDCLLSVSALSLTALFHSLIFILLHR